MILKKQILPTLLTVQKIWEFAAHNAFTDLIRFKDAWYCSFREAEVHGHETNGTLRLLKSQDGLAWQSIAEFEVEGVDLRDPKLSITPTGQLMLLCGGTVLDQKGNYQYLQSRVSFSEDGKNWSPFSLILSKHEWLWRVTWHKGIAYGAAYSRSDPKDKKREWHIKLFESFDGIKFDLITQWEIPGYPNETTIRFLKNNQMVALVRRDRQFDKNAWMGVSVPPYNQWKWKNLNYSIGGPNFIILPDESMWVAGRLIYTIPYAEIEKTFVGIIDLDSIQPLITLPSGGDCSYPGLCYHEGILWVSYYSSHEGKSAIYLARLAL